MRSLLPLAALVALAVASPANAETSPLPSADDAGNIRFNLTMLDTDAVGNTIEQTVETLSVAERGAQTRTHAGWRVPIAVTHSRVAEAGDHPVTSYQYQDVGLALTLEVRSVGSDRVRASGHAEISSVDRQETRLASGAATPQIGTFSHHFETTLLDGVNTPLVTVPKPDGGSVRLILTASIQP